MHVIYQADIENLPPGVATVGFFDGVHAGHRFLINELKEIAQTQQMKSVVVTFNTHPRKVLDDDFQPKLLTTLSEKLVQLESTGIDTCVVLDFSKQIANLSAYEFLKTILFEKYNVRTLLVGHDHRFGHNRADGFPEYKQYGESMGMNVIQATRFATSEFQHISSSEVRLALQRGDIEAANRILTYTYSFQGKVMSGFQVGRKIGFPTANLMSVDPDKLIPPHGVYAVRVIHDKNIYNGMMNIGTRPTLSNDFDTSLEVNIFDFDEDIYNQLIVVEFIQKIRDEKKFNGLNELTTQLRADKQTVLSINQKYKNE